MLQANEAEPTSDASISSADVEAQRLVDTDIVASEGRTVMLGGVASSLAVAGVAKRWVWAGPDATIREVASIARGALSIGNATLQFAINGVAITAGLLTLVQAGSAAGDLVRAAPTGLNALIDGDIITVTVAGTNIAAVSTDLLLFIDHV